MIKFCMEAAAELAKRGVQVEVIDLRTIKPLDIALIAASLRKTHRCVLVEEGHLFAGVCAEVGFQIMEHCFDDLDAPLERVCQRETPMPYSKYLERETMPNKERILAALERVLS
jgi:pyruvate dehydrogenase E1 component beta subunit